MIRCVVLSSPSVPLPYTQAVNDTDGLRQDLFRVNRDLMRERLRCRALEDELETPMNVHRWRKLEGRFAFPDVIRNVPMTFGR